jgi:lysozyme
MQAATLTLIAAAVLLFASTANARANVEAGQGGASFDLGNLTDTLESTMNQITEQTADVTADTAGANIAAFLGMVRQSEGTAGNGDPYAVCYDYSHTITDFSDHPAITGEWTGKTLPPQMCKNAGFGPGCVSTAAGAYQIIKPTWKTIRAALGLPDFGPASQDAAAAELIRRRGALEDVKAGRIASAVNKCRNEWASLPGNYAKQGQRDIDTLLAWYQQNGGNFA